MACLVAEQLAIDRILIHPLAGVLSASAWVWPIYRHINKKRLIVLWMIAREAMSRSISKELERDGIQKLVAQKIDRSKICATHTAYVRYAGSDTNLPIVLTIVKT